MKGGWAENSALGVPVSEVYGVDWACALESPSSEFFSAVYQSILTDQGGALPIDAPNQNHLLVAYNRLQSISPSSRRESRSIFFAETMAFDLGEGGFFCSIIKYISYLELFKACISISISLSSSWVNSTEILGALKRKVDSQKPE